MSGLVLNNLNVASSGFRVWLLVDHRAFEAYRTGLRNSFECDVELLPRWMKQSNVHFSFGSTDPQTSNLKP